MAKSPKSGRDGLESVSITLLQAEINRRGKSLKSLIKRRDNAVEKLKKLNELVAASGGSAVRGGGGRERGTGLRDTIAKVLSGKTMTVGQIADAVVKAGYVTSSPNFRMMVNQQLITNKKLFKRVGRGEYSAG